MAHERELISNGNPMEKIVGFSRAVRGGNFIAVGGTAPVGPDGKTVGIGGRETILAALLARLSAVPRPALRGNVLPERVPADGLLILRDGEPGEPEVTFSPLRYHYQHRAEIEAVV